MREKIKFIKSVFIEGFELFRRSFLKTAAYQAIFKTAFLSVLIMLIGTIISASFEFAKTNLLEGKEISNSFWQLRHILTIGITITILLIVHYLEKVGLIISTSYIFRFKNISYLQIYKKSFKKTPKVIFQKIEETRYLALLIPVIFILWIAIALTGIGGQISTFLYPLLIISVILFAFIIYIRRIFSSYVTCLEPGESPVEFHEKTSRTSRIMKGWVLFLWYCIFVFALLLLFFIIFWIIKISFDIIFSFPDIGLIAFFMAFAITSITFLIIFIPVILGSFRYSLYTVLYYRERKRQEKPFEIESKSNFKISWVAKRGKKFIAMGLLAIFLIISLSLTNSIQKQMESLQTNLENNKQMDISLEYLVREIKTVNTTGDKTRFIFNLVSIFLFDLAQESLEKNKTKT